MERGGHPATLGAKGCTLLPYVVKGETPLSLVVLPYTPNRKGVSPAPYMWEGRQTYRPHKYSHKGYTLRRKRSTPRYSRWKVGHPSLIYVVKGQTLPL